MKHSLLSALAGWIAGAVAFGFVADRLSQPSASAPGWICVGALYSAPIVLLLWLAALWPLYVRVPARSTLWRPLVCVPAGALAGALLYFAVVGPALDWRPKAYFSTLHVFVGVAVGAVACGVGCTLKRRDTRVP
ncbi:MAG: hypothetical protein QOD64_2342 [Verrucomicrobiota bacterium]|jgi:hypothetical protein